MSTLVDKFYAPKQIAVAVSLGVASVGMAQASELEIGGSFEFDYVSVKDGDSSSDLTTLEVVFGKELNANVSSELVLAATDDDADGDATVDDDVEVDSATVTFTPDESGLALHVGIWAAPVGQFNTLSAQDNLGVAQLETLKNRGFIAEYSVSEQIVATVFAGTLDDSSSDDVDGANISATLGDVTFSGGYISNAAGTVNRGTAFSFAYEPGNLGIYYEGVQIDDGSDTDAKDYSVTYTLSELTYPVTLGFGQGELSATGVADTEQTTYTAALTLYEGLDLVLDYADLDEPSGKTETTTFKIAYSF